jgi:hypothetical protein
MAGACSPLKKKSCEKIWIREKEPYLYTINETEKQKSTTMYNLKNILSAAAIAERQRLTVNLVQSETHRNDHSAALVWVASFVCKTTTDGERWMKANAIICVACSAHSAT